VTKLAVLFVHGVEIADERFADTAIGLLSTEFRRIAGVDADDALVVATAFWAPVYERRQDVLLDRMGGGPAKRVFGLLDKLGSLADRGYTSALLAAAGSALVRSLPWAPEFHFPTLRWLLVHYLGDAISYQAGSVDSTLYDDVHVVVAKALHELAAQAGPDAPLCVVGHSLGTLVTSNFFYDLQAAEGLHPGEGPKPVVSEQLGDTPLERGETFAWFWSLGSPIALWAQRFTDFGVPVTCPHPKLGDHHPDLEGAWTNVWDPDDVVSSPLRRLNAAYEAAVAEDRRVDVGPWPLGATPLAHPYYWNDRRVITPIASALAQAWHRVRARA
jgi:hypothetical protein